jgi:hypothetical protein
MASFLEKLIDADCGNGRRSLKQVAQSLRILLPREYIFQRMSDLLPHSRLYE